MGFGFDLLSLVLDALELLIEFLLSLTRRGEWSTKVFVLRVRNAAAVGNRVWRWLETVCGCLETGILLLELSNTTEEQKSIRIFFVIITRRKQKLTFP